VDNTTEKTKSSSTSNNNGTVDGGCVDANWTEEFIKQAAVQFEQSMQTLLSQSK
jgi:hypothetical protein